HDGKGNTGKSKGWSRVDCRETQGHTQVRGRCHDQQRQGLISQDQQDSGDSNKCHTSPEWDTQTKKEEGVHQQANKKKSCGIRRQLACNCRPRGAASRVKPFTCGSLFQLDAK